MKRSPVSLFVLRSIKDCSTPHSSGNSERIVRPPNTVTKSETCPTAGFAEMPENPSEPPHLSPTHRLDNGVGARCSLSALTSPRNVALQASESMLNSEPL